MPIRRLGNLPAPCADKDHHIPELSLPPGIYVHYCPSCYRVDRFAVDVTGLMIVEVTPDRAMINSLQQEARPMPYVVHVPQVPPDVTR